MAGSLNSTSAGAACLLGFSMLLLSLGCGEPAAIELALVPNGEINDPISVLEQIGKVEYVVDSSQGLYPSSAEQRGDWLEIYDRDDDGDAELVATVDITGMDHLPLVRLEQGGIKASSVLIVVQGLARDQQGEQAKYIAHGELREGMGRFIPGSVRVHEIEFNIKPAYRPPKVDDFSLVQQLEVGVTGVVLEFTKQMDHGSLQQANVIQVLQQGAGGTEAVAGEIRIADLTHSDPDVGFFTRVDYLFSSALKPGTYLVEVSTQATDASPDQRPLDQRPMQRGDQPYSFQFVVTS